MPSFFFFFYEAFLEEISLDVTLTLRLGLVCHAPSLLNEKPVIVICLSVFPCFHRQ